MAKFTYDDIVRIKETSVLTGHRGSRAWIVGILADRNEYSLKGLPPGVVYTVEFEGGEAVDVHEDDLDLENDSSTLTPG